MTFAMMLDIVVAGLLIVTIGFAVVLNRKLGLWRQDKAALEAMIGQFNQAATRAEASISALRALSEQTGASLVQALGKGQVLRDDLDYLAERGAQIAERLAAHARPRAVAAAETPSSLAAAELGGANAGPRSAAERELAKSLLGVH